MEYLLAALLFAILVAVYIYQVIKGIEAAEAEYDADPEGYERRHPEIREMF